MSEQGWEKTVMSDATKRQFIYVKNKPDNNLRGFMEEAALECQAEISYKAGHTDGQMSMLLDQPALILEAKQAGMGEVVEWIDKNNTHGWPAHAWQQFLKEKGL